jgi:hypothetical protein
LYVYETYDPEKESVHDASVCKTCKEWEEVRRDERRRQAESSERRLERRVDREERRKGKERQRAGDEDATRILEEYMQDYGRRAGVATEASRTSSMDFKPLDSRFGKDIFSAAAKSAAAMQSRGSVPHSGAASEPSDSEYESDSPDSDGESSSSSASDSDDDDPQSRPRRPLPKRPLHRARKISVPSNDLPRSEPASFDPHSQSHLPAAHVVGAPEGCCDGVKDIVITGETPRRHLPWHRQMYRLYGRVREWDGMIGLLRVDERSVPGYSSGLQLGADLEESEYWSVITNMFICGYIVGGRTFVGEWRMAASDPLKPGWSGPIMMSLREQEDGEVSAWEPVGGDAI